VGNSGHLLRDQTLVLVVAGLTELVRDLGESSCVEGLSQTWPFLIEGSRYFQVLVLFLNQVDEVNTKVHFLLCEAILEELLVRDGWFVAKIGHHHTSCPLKELEIWQVLSVRVQSLSVQPFSDRRRGPKHSVV